MLQKAKKGTVVIHGDDGSLSYDGSVSRYVYRGLQGSFTDYNYKVIPIDSTFEAVLKFNGSSFKNLTTGGHYNFFDSYKNDLIEKNVLHFGIICGKWGYKKLGNRYSVYLIEQYL